jgi:hypothetical protein
MNQLTKEILTFAVIFLLVAATMFAAVIYGTSEDVWCAGQSKRANNEEKK